MPFQLTQVLAGIIPKARLTVYPDAGHLLFLEKAQEINQTIIEFLSGRE
jgi:pimeloyl-ACP methyl ester carboxylesterase